MCFSLTDCLIDTLEHLWHRRLAKKHGRSGIKRTGTLLRRTLNLYPCLFPIGSLVMILRNMPTESLSLQQVQLRMEPSMSRRISPRQGKTIVYMTSRWRMPAHGSEAESGHAHNSKLVDLLLSGFQIGSKAQQDGEIIIRTLRTYCRLPVIL